MSAQLLLDQPALPGMCLVSQAVEALASASSTEGRGAVFTRAEVVNFILDLVGYTTDQPLHRVRLLEPSFGGGDFLLRAVRRLIVAWRAQGGQEPAELADCVHAVELHRASFVHTKQALCGLLTEFHFSAAQAQVLADGWLMQGDFLLQPLPGMFDVIVGNPPYVRQEMIPAPLLAEYRSRYTSLYDRADLYVPFIEKALRSLANRGALGFICADRWMKNKYGGPLRRMVANGYNLRVYVDMVDTPAFHTEVTAYPAITVIAREPKGYTRVAQAPDICPNGLAQLASALTSGHAPYLGGAVRDVLAVSDGDSPWVLESDDRMALVCRLEQAFPTLEEASCKVGIGVATGADEAFIAPYEDLDVEPDRKLPLVTTKDISSGEVVWRGLGVINPFLNSGALAPLDQYPKLKQYLEARRDRIANRHVARKTPAGWYRTIDRITPSLAARPKLLIPDIKGEANIVYQGGGLYPHHNLYYIVSDEWDLHALQAVLLSGIARLFVATYSTKMRGGYLRFQAQYLRRIRVPHWGDVPPDLRSSLRQAAKSMDLAACRRLASDLYQLSPAEQAILDDRA